MVPLSRYWSNLHELLQHKKPTLVSFIFKPGIYIVLVFWVFYLSSLVYYTGKDRMERYTMTKMQNRDDLAEIKDNSIQNVNEIVLEMMIRDNVIAASKIESDRLALDEVPKEKRKFYQMRARKKVFGRIGTMHERAQRFYKRSYKFDPDSSNVKMKFF